MIFICYESRTLEHIFFCAVFVILKISTAWAGKERQKQSILTSHSGNTSNLKEYNIIHVKCGHALAMLLTKEISLLELLHVKVYTKL